MALSKAVSSFAALQYTVFLLKKIFKILTGTSFMKKKNDPSFIFFATWIRIFNEFITYDKIVKVFFKYSQEITKCAKGNHIKL
jgi:hypothetical protein